MGGKQAGSIWWEMSLPYLQVWTGIEMASYGREPQRRFGADLGEKEAFRGESPLNAVFIDIYDIRTLISFIY